MGVYPAYGGVEQVSTILANAFVERGHEVSIVSFEQPHPELQEQELCKSVRVYKLNHPVSDRHNIEKLHRILVERNIAIIINQWAVPYYVARLCRKAMKGLDCKLITVHHNQPDTNARIKDIEIDIEKGKGILFVNKLRLAAVKAVSRLSLRYTYDKSDRFVVLSQNFIPIVEKYICRHPAQKLIAISNPITIDIAEDTVLSKEKEIIYVGRIEYNQKRTFRIVNIWKDIEPQHPDWTLTIVGDGPDRPDLEKRIEEAGLKNIRITGFTNPINYYKRASILLLVSEYEGYGLVIVEASAFGVVPIVLGSYAAVYDVIGRHSGIVATYPYNKQEFVNDVLYLMDNDDKRGAMSKEAKIMAEKFKLGEIANRWEQLFNQI